MTSSLYLCYQSILEPLTSTQVIAYLEGLAKSGYGITLLTFEPRRLSAEETRTWRAKLAELGITWTWVRYHKWPSVPATAWDVLIGTVVGLSLIYKHRISLVHARAHVPALMAWMLKKLAGVRFLFDIRGLMAEEYVDAGVWPAGGFLFRLTKRIERRLVRRADGIVVLTHKARELLQQWYPEEIQNKPIQVIPCCVDLSKYPARSDAGLNGSEAVKTITYIGKLGGWYLTEAMITFMTNAMRQMPELRWEIWTQSDPSALGRAISEQGVSERVSVGRVPAEQIPEKLRKASAGLSFIKPCVSKLASSPTKVGEYLAAGVPVISTEGIGDTSELLEGERAVGMVVADLSPAGLEAAVPRLRAMLETPGMPARCRKIAAAEFDLLAVGWERYREIYRKLVG